MIKQYLLLFVKRIQTTDELVTGKLELSITYNGVKRTPSHKPLLRNGVAVFYDEMLKFELRKENPTVQIDLFRLRPSSTSLLLSTTCSVSDFKPDEQLRVKFNQSQTYIDILSDINNGADQTRSLRRQPSVPRERSVSRDDNRSQRSKVQRELDQEFKRQRQTSLGRGSFKAYKPQAQSRLVSSSGNQDTKSVYTPKAVSKKDQAYEKASLKIQAKDVEPKTYSKQANQVPKISEVKPTPAKSGPSRQSFQKASVQRTIKPFQRSIQKTQTKVSSQSPVVIEARGMEKTQQALPKDLSAKQSNISKSQEQKAQKQAQTQPQQMTLEGLLKASVVSFLIGVYLGYSM